MARLTPVDPIEGEEWREIPGLEGTGYEVSNLGRVRSIVLMVGSKDRRGYPTASLRRVSDAFGERNGSAWNVHVLVARAFLGRRPAGLEVNHKDGCLTNNRADNLEYVTHLENCRHAHRLGLIDYSKIGRKGEANSHAKLTEKAVRFIRQKRGRMSIRALAKTLGVSHSAVEHVMYGSTWAHVQ